MVQLKELVKEYTVSLFILLSEYYNKIVVFFLLATIMYIVIGLSSIISYINYNHTTIENRIKMFSKISKNKTSEHTRKQLCLITQCKEILEPIKLINEYTKNNENNEYGEYTDYIVQKNLLENNNISFIKTIKKDFDYIEVNGVLIDTRLDFYIKIEGKIVDIDVSKMIDNLIYYYFYIMFLIMSVFIAILWVSLRQEKHNSMTLLMSNEAVLANKSMILITENIHHELNTPMEIIENKVYKLKDIILPFIEDRISLHSDLTQEEKNDLKEDFNYIIDASEQVYAVLDRMRSFKHIRYSNGNKSVRDSIIGAFQMISISNSNFTYDVDKTLAKYSISNSKLKNADLLNIILNHLKNSLEANSTAIFILIEEFDDEFVYFRIIDNGNGIKNQNYKKIFEPNFSTKDTPGEIRGNGLYLNKSILNSVGGDVNVVSSTKYGTTFELKVPAELRQSGELVSDLEELTN